MEAMKCDYVRGNSSVALSTVTYYQQVVNFSSRDRHTSGFRAIYAFAGLPPGGRQHIAVGCLAKLNVKRRHAQTRIVARVQVRVAPKRPTFSAKLLAIKSHMP